MFKFIKRLIKLSLIAAIIVMIYLVYQFNPFRNEQPALNQPTTQNGTTYTLEDNLLFSNIPLSQVKNAFYFMDKQEFMDVSGLTLMGYNAEYIIGQRGNEYIMYKFGDRQVTVFQNETDLNQALAERSQSIQLKDRSQY
ncbi:DUF4930 family protein [Macrococcoides caseolyticum]|uniref:DUF4930 family protein n=1 Tax=Macrococcoides caseolyticum TaxID=69966 RepID=UPI001F1C2279|nr:DUF4930 family protein [Macrococcus caseolyticus]MCE4956225.1 DUF4930 family protein [Macrococcus caseolyticus]